MKLLLAVLKRIHKPDIYVSHRRCLSSGASSGLSPLRDEALIVGSSPELVQRLGSQVEVRTGFITEEEEGAFMRELELGLKKKRYEFDHWDDSVVNMEKLIMLVQGYPELYICPMDDTPTNSETALHSGFQAIHGYRETERLRWGAACEEVLNRVRSVAFPEGSPLLGPVHVLDLDKNGYIKPHIDSVKFCGSTIAGLSLLSDSIMRLVKEDATNDWLDLLLPRLSLYILRDEARYNFTHEILKDEESVFNGQKVPRLRRISVICRNLPG